MQKSFITTIDAWRFERPLAIVLGASAMFMVAAVPSARFAGLSGVTAHPAAHLALALVAGVVLGIAGYRAMAHPWPRRPVATPQPDADAIPEDEQGQFAAAEVSLRLRRADRHPDAPVRAPIFASRDLGSPFMEVGAFAPPPAIDPSDDAHEDAIPDADYAEIADVAPATAAEPAHEPETAPAQDAAEMPAPIAAFAPDDQPVPAPARAPRQSIAAMMERLSEGLERRAAHGEPLPAPDRQPALRDALDELNRLAARRG